MNPDFVLVTLSTPEIESYSLATESTKRRYCEQHGYRFVAYASALDNRPPSWSKLLALLEGFERYPAEWFFWLDADAMIINPAVRLETLVDSCADLLITHDSNGLNAGSFLLRRNERTAEFLRKVYAKTAFVDHPWWDQAAMVEVLYGGETDLAVRYFPQRAINAYVGAAREDEPRDFVLHLPGMGLDERVRQVNRTLLGCDFASRAELPQIITAQCGVHPVGAEVGVLRGEFSEYLLSSVSFSAFHCIDAWRHLPGRIDITNLSDAGHEENYQATRARLARFAPMVQMQRCDSIEAAGSLPDEALDFIYIDGDHSYDACLADLEAYYPKVKRGGILAGHDYLDGSLAEGEFGVKRAVGEFVRRSKHDGFFVSGGAWPSWLLIK